MRRTIQGLLGSGIAVLLAASPAGAGPPPGHGGGHPGGHGGGHVAGIPGGKSLVFVNPGFRTFNPGFVNTGPFVRPFPVYTRPNIYGSGYWPGYGFGFGLTLSGMPYRSLGSLYPYTSYYDTMPFGYIGGYSAPATGAVLGMPAVVDPTAPPDLTPIPPPSPTPPGAAAVYLTVLVPDGAKVWVADVLSQQTGQARSFVSPPIEPGADFNYTVRATWTDDGKPVERTKRVTVRAGERVTVNMMRPE